MQVLALELFKYIARVILVARKYSVFILGFFLSLHCVGQQRFQYPTALSQFFTTYSLLNPASAGSDDKFAIRVGEQMNTGYFSRIRTHFAISEVAFKKESRKSHHAIGLWFMSNEEGKLISFNRAHLQYSYHLALNEEWKLAAGISTGFLNLTIDQTATSGNVSSFAPDGGFGFYLYEHKQKMGFSVGQVLDKSIRSINEQIPIHRFYTFFYTRKMEFSPSVKLVPSLLYSFRNEYHLADLNLSLSLQDLVFFGSSYRYQKGSAYFLGISDFDFLGGLADLTLSYNSPWPSTNLANIQSFELVLSYKIKARED